jgi:L-ascorbate metabolism protein UlaG (beta-lactamase superfamily)
MWNKRPFVIRKLEQLWKVVRESHAQPIVGEPKPLDVVADGELGITFIGHSSFLLQVGGKNVLVDPVFAKRLIILRRQKRPGLRLKEMPPIDIVLLTHAHMDHLDISSLRKVVRMTKGKRIVAPAVVVPRGVEDLVTKLGFARVHGMEWWDELVVDGIRVTMTPCKHWGARMFRDTHRGYGGFFVTNGGVGVYHSGDTAYFEGFAEVGRRLRPAVALLPIGAYYPDSYRAVHTSPEEAVRAFVECAAQWMVPMHYGTFLLGREPREEPVLRLTAEAKRLGIEDRVRVLEEGETMVVQDLVPTAISG